MEIYRTKKNETLYDAASSFSLSPVKLGYDNETDNPRRLAEGRELLIRKPTRTYTAKGTDTLKTVAHKFGISTDELLRENAELSESPLYAGEVLYVRSMPPAYGMGVGIGYVFRGCSERKLKRAMPYLNYLNVSAAVAAKGGISLLFEDIGAVEEAKSQGKIPLLRIYCADGSVSPSEIIDSAIILAIGHGYSGICFAGFKMNVGQGMEIKKKLMCEDLLMFIEKDLRFSECTDYADGTILSYDKLQLKEIPSFSDGEEKYMRKYAERCATDTAFIELSPFALANGKYIEKTKAWEIADRNSGSFEYDSDTKLLYGSIGRGRKERRVIAESLENTKSKLDLTFELGFMGIAFDVERTPLAELLLFGELFATPKSTKDRAVCNPKD